MSNINDLIKKECPNGVLFKSLSDIASITIGEFVHKNKQNENSEYPVYNGGISNTGFYEEYNNDGKNVIISARGANAGYVNRVYGKYWAGNSCYSIKIKDEKEVNWIYLYHYLKNKQKDLLGEQQTGSIPAVSKKQVENLKIAIPTIHVQEEIVKFLDKFSELEKELEAELEVRQKQYEYCLTKINEMKEQKVKLEEICDVSAGGTPSKAHSEYWENGTIKWLGSTVCENKKGVSEITNFITELGLSKSSAKLLKPETTLIAMVGATIGKVAYVDFESCTNQNIASLYPKNTETLDPSYLYHACRSLYPIFLNYANGKFAMASLGFIKGLEIPIPNINKQKRIANFLDKFDMLINDITYGIPAEIELRKKQYEYYRDRLLSFEEVSVSE